MDGPGSNPGGDEILPSVETGPGAHPAFCKMGIGSFPGVKCGRGVLLTTHPLLDTSTHPLGHTGPVTGTFYLFLISVRG